MTKQAFSLSRQKVSWEAFNALNEEMICAFYDQDHINLFKGKYLILAIDGSTINLPGTLELEKYFGRIEDNSEKGRVLGKISVLYDVLNKIDLNVQIVPYRSSEKEMAIQSLKWLGEFIKKTNKKIILLFDRGYPCIGLFLLLQKMNIDFVCRAQASVNQGIIKQLHAQKDGEVMAGADDRRKKKSVCSWLGVVNASELQTLECKLRALRIKDGFILFTSLMDVKKFNLKIINKLYSLRWAIENNYRSIKVDTLLENFSGKKVLIIFQEIHATIFIQNLARIYESDIIRGRTKQINKKYFPNHREVLGIMKEIIFRMYREGPGCITKMLKCIKVNWERSPPGRNYKRITTGCRLRSRFARVCYA